MVKYIKLLFQGQSQSMPHGGASVNGTSGGGDMTEVKKEATKVNKKLNEINEKLETMENQFKLAAMGGVALIVINLLLLVVNIFF